MTSNNLKQLKNCFRKLLILLSEGRLSGNDLSCIIDVVQDYLNCHISIRITNDLTEFSEACDLKNHTEYDYVDDVIVPWKTVASCFLASSKGVKPCIRHDLCGEMLSILGSIEFPNDRTSFVLVRHETFEWGQKDSAPLYFLTILIPE